ncbi:hypothetical protein ACFL12_06835, partial [Pseudomonadota bacterium]
TIWAQSAAAEGPSLRMYGNWCGPGNAVFNNFPPVDPLDNACMRHDRCYVANGVGTCGCDVVFMRELRNMSYPNPDAETRARAMYDALAMTPCDDPGGWAVKQSLMWSDIAADAVSGRATPFEVPARWMYLFSRSDPYY